MAEETKEEMLKRISENRGYSLEMHRIMAEADSYTHLTLPTIYSV